MTTQTVFDQALEALAILRVNRPVQLSHSSQAKVADAVSALLAAKQDAVSDAQPVTTDGRITTFNLISGGTLVRDDMDDVWLLYVEGKLIRGLNKFEADFIDSALKAASPAPDVRPSVPVSDEARETLMRAVEGAIARSEEIGEDEWYNAKELQLVSNYGISLADAEYIAALTPMIAFGFLSAPASVPAQDSEGTSEFDKGWLAGLAAATGPEMESPSVPVSDEQIKPRDGWAVHVEVDGERILSIESECLSGVPDIDRYADTVRNCAQHLLSFIGDGEPSDFFPPDDAPLATQPTAPDSEDTPERHYDDYAVDCFAQMMKEKLAKKRAEGRGGWNDPAQCSVEYLNRLLLDHVEKGDPVDVANFCMMLRHYDAKITTEPQKFDAWMANPYTKVLQKSVEEDYVPKSTVQAAPSVPDEMKPIPIAEIGSILNEVMELAVKNGANSVSMPNEYVAVAHFVSCPEEYVLAPSAPSVSADAGSQPCPACKGEGAVATDELDVVPCITCQDVEGDADSAAASADAADQMDIDREGARFWHRNCANHLGGVMKVVKDEPTQSLIQCLHCSKSGYYPVGGVGRIRAAIAGQSNKGGAA